MASENPFLNARVFDPRTAERVTAACERNAREALDTGANTTDTVAVDSLASRIRTDTEVAITAGAKGLAKLEQIANPDTRLTFEAGFTAAEQLFGRLNLTIPTVEELISSGVDLMVLAAAYERMQAEGLEPAVVLSPDLDLNRWYYLYQTLQGDPIVNSDGHLNGGGLLVDGMIGGQWNNLRRLPDSVPITLSRSDKAGTDRVISWSIRLIPGAPNPATSGGEHSVDRHPTIGEYLSLQATRLQANQEQLDSQYGLCWLGDSFSGSDGHTRAPIGHWDTSVGRVSITYVSAGLWLNDSVARQPVWE